MYDTISYHYLPIVKVLKLHFKTLIKKKVERKMENAINLPTILYYFKLYYFYNFDIYYVYFDHASF